MVRDPGQQDLHVHAAPGRGLEGVEQDVVGHKIGVGEQDVLLGALNSRDIHVADGEGELQGVRVAGHDQRVEPPGVLARDAFTARAMAVPEGHE